MPELVCRVCFLEDRGILCRGVGGGDYWRRFWIMIMQLQHTFEDIISVNNLCAAWEEFVRGKRGKRDVQLFASSLMENIVQLHHDFANQTYRHGGYKDFFVSDPKRRHIHKASVRDRLVHHAVYRVLYPFFDHTFIADSYSCRMEKGTHRALDRFRAFAYQVSHNHTRTAWVLQCDIRKFFESIDHAVLRSILEEAIPDLHIIGLLANIIASFSVRPGVGLPLGNLTSQLFVNVYMNVFDQWVKHRLQAHGYMRYADDFVLFSSDRCALERVIPYIEQFLRERLGLALHPSKVSIRTIASGVDFLGWVHFPDHRILRTATRRRMLRRMQERPTDATMQSYLGLLSHGNALGLQQALRTCRVAVHDEGGLV